jgi:hypothetical protein
MTETAATSRCVTITWTKAVSVSTRTSLRRTRARAVGLPLEVHVNGVPGSRPSARPRPAPSGRVDTARTCALLSSAVHGSLARGASEGKAGAAYVPLPTVPDAGAGRHYQLRHWSAGTISASTSDAFSRSTFPPTT